MRFTLWSYALIASFSLCFPLSASAEQELVLPQVSCKVEKQRVFLRWEGLPGLAYQVESTADLMGEWNEEGERFLGDGGGLHFSEEPAEGAKFYRIKVARPVLKKLALIGDSGTAIGHSKLDSVYANAYGGWARMFGGSRWDLVRNGSRLCFATSGAPAVTISANNLAAVIESDADACLLAYGTNDAARLFPVSSLINQSISDWHALRAAGIEPIATTVLPMGNLTEKFLQSPPLIVQYNMEMRAAAAQHQVALCDWTEVLEEMPGSNNGIGLNSHFINSDDIHPDPFASSLIGRVLNATLERHFEFGVDVWVNKTWLTDNPGFAGSDGKPTHWNLHPPSGGSVLTQTLVNDPAGNWWEIGFTNGSSPSNFHLTYSAANVASPAGKRVESVIELRVMSGSLDYLILNTLENGGTLVSSELLNGIREGIQVGAEDGVVVLRTQPVVLGSGTTRVQPHFSFTTGAESAVIRIRRMGVREVP